MPGNAAAGWSIDTHDRLLSRCFRQVWCRRAVDVPQLPRKPWVTPEVHSWLAAHAEAPVAFCASGRALRLAHVRVAFFARQVGCFRHFGAMAPFRACPWGRGFGQSSLGRVDHLSLLTAKLQVSLMLQLYA